jgi:hypothetical protein
MSEAAENVVGSRVTIELIFHMVQSFWVGFRCRDEVTASYGLRRRNGDRTKAL